MFLSLFLTCFVSLGITTLLLLALGHRTHVASRILGLLLAIVSTGLAGELAARVFDLPPGQVLAGEVVLVGVQLLIVALRPQWNPFGQAFYGSLLASAGTYVCFAGWYTAFGGLSAVGAIASGVLFVFELFALAMTGWYAFDTCDTASRVRWDRPIQPPDPTFQPKVSLQIAAYNEPPDMLIETIKSVEAIEYPDLEIVVIDNNTEDPEVWRPVEAYCRDRPRVKFVHVDEWPGFKAGALNLALTEYTHPDAEIVGVVDADYLLRPDYLEQVVGYFADPDLAFLQTPQDYREWKGDRYLTACYDAYKYFFATSMPSRNQRDSIIFAGTMGLIRRSVLERLGGWDEWCITEDAVASLRMLKAGYSGLYINESFGRGIMPLTFTSLKSQRYRWCFGGIQILKRHWRSLMPGRRHRGNQLTTGQRLDYLFGGLHWFNDLAYLGFSIVLLTSAVLLLTEGSVEIRPLLGTVVMLPSALIVSGLLRAIWALRATTGIGTVRALRAFANWLSMSWTVAVACLQSLFRSDAVFMRTPKTSEDPRPIDALRMARPETALAIGLFGAGAAVAVWGAATPFVVTLFAWQGTVYATSLYMSWMNVRAKLTPELARRRRSERLRERRSARLAMAVGGAGALATAAAFAAVLFLGGSNPGNPTNPFEVPEATEDGSPLESLIEEVTDEPTTSPTPDVSGTVSPTESPTESPSESPTPTESPTPSETESPSPSPSPTPTPASPTDAASPADPGTP